MTTSVIADRATPIGFQATIQQPADTNRITVTGRITVTAHLGTQAIGSSTGSPMDATNEGPVVLTVVGDDGVVATLTITEVEYLDALISALKASQGVQFTRDRRLDLPRTV